jgi:hypothetical protein
MLTWEQKQFVTATKAAAQKMGRGWDKIGPEYRALLIKAEVLSIIAMNADFEDTPQGRLAVLAMQHAEETP